jgi:hypothetical protein
MKLQLFQNSNPSTTLVSTLPTTVYNSPLTTKELVLKIGLGAGIPVILIIIVLILDVVILPNSNS